MFNKKYIFFLAGAAVIASSCKNEEIAEFDQADDITLTASFGEESSSNELKTTLIQSAGKYVGSWNVNDTVLVYDGTNAVKFYSTEAGPVKAKLKRVKGEPTFTTSDNYLVYYPGEKATYNGEGGFNVTLPSTQIYNTDGTVSDDAYPMMSKASTLQLPFYNLCTVLKVNVTCEVPTKITKLMFSSYDNVVAGSGVATFDGEFPSLDMGKPTGTASRVTLDCGEGVEVGPKGSSFYIVLPAGNYSAGKFVNSKGKELNYNLIYVQIPGVGAFSFPLEFDLEMKRSSVYKYDGTLNVYLGTGTLGQEGDNVE